MAETPITITISTQGLTSPGYHVTVYDAQTPAQRLNVPEDLITVHPLTLSVTLTLRDGHTIVLTQEDLD